jgi:hypothetical protein
MRDNSIICTSKKAEHEYSKTKSEIKKYKTIDGLLEYLIIR